MVPVGENKITIFRGCMLANITYSDCQQRNRRTPAGLRRARKEHQKQTQPKTRDGGLRDKCSQGCKLIAAWLAQPHQANVPETRGKLPSTWQKKTWRRAGFVCKLQQACSHFPTCAHATRAYQD